MSGLIILLLSLITANAQIVINEASNRNYSTIADEDGEFKDWIELFNSGDEEVSLLNYSLSDDISNLAKWSFPNIVLMPGEFKTVFCSGKNRKPISAFEQVAYVIDYTPVTNWNTHVLAEPFYWDGVSNVLINICAYNSYGYTSNSVFRQSETSYFSTAYAFQDDSDNICSFAYGTRVKQRPNIKLNNAVIGTGNIQNGNTDYPAPYGNWYWAAKHQILITGDELIAAGLTIGNITSLSFDVVSTDPNTVYSYLDVYMKMVTETELSTDFIPIDVNLNEHTNFSISGQGETVYLSSPEQQLLSQLEVNCINLNNSCGLFPDASTNVTIFGIATPSATNNASQTYSSFLLAPIFSVNSGIYDNNFQVAITNPNVVDCEVRYTIDGSDPGPDSEIYIGTPINIYFSSILKARAFSDSDLPSPLTVSSYLIGISHTTPVISVVTDASNLYGDNGIFDNWSYDWEKAAYVEYFDNSDSLIFSQAAGMQIDGGAGGSRSNPQHSFRIELDNSVLGEGHIHYPLISGRPQRTKYSKFYLRNGSNQYLTLPYKDAALVTSLGAETKNYYSAMEPVTVYINGQYFGLYELREKIDDEYFEEYDQANPDSLDILTLSYWYGLILRATVGSTEHFYTAYYQFLNVEPTPETFWNDADQYFDMENYIDYIIAESYAGNTDWPYNNIKIYSSDKTENRFRFAIVDLELCLAPNGWSSTSDNPIEFLFTRDPNLPYINIWLRGIQNEKFKNYFINRFADLMNTVYLNDRILGIENEFFTKMVSEMPKEYARWGNPNDISGQMNNFIENHNILQSELAARTGYVREYINTGFELDGQVEVTINALPEGAGKIRISTVMPESLPWSGIYFNGNPVTITAIANNGYDFAYWDINSILTEQNPNASITLNISSEATFNAVFTESEFIGEIAISEINYHSDSTRDAGDWVELHNFGNGNIDISGWRFTDGTVSNDFFFPEGTILEPDDRIVLSQNLVLFNTQNPGIETPFVFDFGFSNSGEALSLYDELNSLYLNVHYIDSLDWPKAADGYGRTLELRNDTLDPNLGENWFAGCIGGSPGEAYSHCLEEIIFSEINYNSDGSADAGDWVELHNLGSEEINISGWKLRDDDDAHTFEIPQGTIIPDSGYIVLYANYDKFISRFPELTNLTGPFGFGFGGSGDAVRLFDQNGNLYQSVLYSNLEPWPQGAAGNGFTLELLDENGIFCDANNWIDGCPEGSPGEAYYLPCGPHFVESESLVNVYAYPNPTSDLVTISAEDLPAGEYKIICKNIFGQVVFEKTEKLNGSNLNISFSVADFSEGLYFVTIESGELRSLIKIVKQNK